MFLKRVSAAILSLVAISAPLYAADDSPLYSVPKLSDVAVDGTPDDWGDKGFKVSLFGDPSGKSKPAANFSASFRLGWNDKGLLVLASVKDDVASEPADKLHDIWKGDSIEVFMATKRGEPNSVQFVIAPGLDEKHNQLRINMSDYRKEKKAPYPTAEAKRTKVEGGYVLEALLPWKNLNIEPTEGSEVAFQFYANDSDAADDRFQLLWYPKPDAHLDSNNMHRILLAASPSPAVQASVSGVLVDGRGEVTVVAADDLKGKSIKIKDGDKTVGKGKLEEDGGRVTATIKLDKPKDKEQGYGALEISVDDTVLTTIKLSAPAQK